MIYLLNWRILAALAIVAALAVSHTMAYRKGSANVRSEWAVATAKANAEARALEQERQAGVDKAARLAAARTNRILADARNALAQRDGLRGDLDAARQFAKESQSAAERVAGLATELLDRCAGRYLGVAESAARADSEARELRQAWPK